MKGRGRSRVLRLEYFERSLAIGVIVGAFSGLIIVAFECLLAVLFHFFSILLGYSPRGNWYDFSILAKSVSNPMMIIASLLIGSSISSFLVYRFAPEAEGAGANASIFIYHVKGAEMRPQTPFVKVVASSFTVASGGSGGLQGPGVQIGAGMGSLVARIFRLGVWERRVAFITGIASALSAIFRSPIGASIYAVEVLYQRDFEASAFIPAIIGSVVSYVVTIPFFGFKPPFPPFSVVSTSLYTPKAILSYVILGIFVTPFSVLYVKAFEWVRKSFSRLQMKYFPIYFKPVLGALCTALLGIAIPQVLGIGKGAMWLLFQGGATGNLSFFQIFGLGVSISLLIVAVAKVFSTAFTIASGGSGGVFGPAIFVGSMVGMDFGLILGHGLSGLSPVVFAYIGMAAFFGAISKTPLAVSIMVSEMTHDYAFIFPALVASIISREICGTITMYPAQLMRRLREELRASYTMYHRARELGVSVEGKLKDFALSFKGKVCVGERKGEILKKMISLGEDIMPVYRGERPIGVIDLYFFEHHLTKLEAPLLEKEVRRVPILSEEATIGRALREMVRGDFPLVLVNGQEVKYFSAKMLAAILAEKLGENIKGRHDKSS